MPQSPCGGQIPAPRNSQVSPEQFLSHPILHCDLGKQMCRVPSSKPEQFPKSCCIPVPSLTIQVTVITIAGAGGAGVSAQVTALLGMLEFP